MVSTRYLQDEAGTFTDIVIPMEVWEAIFDGLELFHTETEDLDAMLDTLEEAWKLARQFPPHLPTSRTAD